MPLARALERGFGGVAWASEEVKIAKVWGGQENENGQ